MDQKIRLNPTFEALRKKAEQIVTGKPIDLPDFNELDLIGLVHEIEIQHVELELQNQELRQALHDLEESRNKFYELYQTAPIAFVTVNDRGFIEQINEAAARLLPGSDDFLVGQSFATLIVSEDQQAFFSFLKNHALRKAASCCELRLKANGQPTVHIHLEAKALYDEKGKHRQWRFGMIDITQLKQVEEELRKARDELEDRVTLRTAELYQRNKQLVRLTTELTLAEQRERRRLADLLHDHLQQLLAGARLNLEVAVAENSSSQDSALIDAYDLVSQSLVTSRTLSAELSPSVLYMHGLTEAFLWLTRWMKKTHKLQVDWHAETIAAPAQEELKILLFQSVREMLFNVVKHAGTHTARVDLQAQDKHMVITVSDEGGGFDPEELWKHDRSADKAYGLFNIRERLLLLGGDFDIQSRKGVGTTVRISVPMQTVAFDLPDPKADPVAEEHPNYRPAPAEHNNPSGPLRVMLVDDHAVMRKGLSSLLARKKDISVVAEAADGAQAVEAAQRINPDIILMDISMPVMDGIEATRRIMAQQPHIRIIALSMHGAEDQSLKMQSAGAVGYLSKTGSPEEIVSAIRQQCDAPGQ
jgi:PAS domain S-box-containing protein